MQQSLRLITYNICKGNGARPGRRYEVARLGEALAAEQADVVLCQEVFHHAREAAHQTRELAAALGMRSYYRPNKHRRIGHHGNATFSNLPVEEVENFDLSINGFERRGMLYVRLGAGEQPVHVFNAHLSLSHTQRMAQLARIESIFGRVVGEEDPVVLAGDFNDWRRLLDPEIIRRLGFTNAFAQAGRRDVLTWHARRPVFNLDRIYLRNIEVGEARRLDGDPWRDLSDHLPLGVTLQVDAQAAEPLPASS